MTSGRDQKSDDMATGPNALSRMSRPWLAGARAKGNPRRQKATRYIEAITLRGMGYRVDLAEGWLSWRNVTSIRTRARPAAGVAGSLFVPAGRSSSACCCAARLRQPGATAWPVMAPAVQAEPLSLLAADCFPGEAAAVGESREFVRSVLGDYRPGLDDVLLMVSEIASNAV